MILLTQHQLIEVAKLFFAPLISGGIVAAAAVCCQYVLWRKQKRREQQIGLIRDWESFVGAAEYAYIFESSKDSHPDSVLLLLTRQKGLLASIRSVFLKEATLKSANTLSGKLSTLGDQAWLKSQQPKLGQLREDLLEQMNKEAFA